MEQNISKSVKPEPGSVYSGTLVGIAERQGKYGRFPLVVIDTEQGRIDFALPVSVVSKIVPLKGKHIALKYLGRDILGHHAWNLE